MSTRSVIAAAIPHSEGVAYRSIYCHFDGYPSYNGKILQEHFSEYPRILRLLNLGSLSVLAPKILKPKGHSFATPVKGYCIAYHRDRGEDLDISNHPDKDSFIQHWADSWCEYAYLYENGEWHVSECRKDVSEWTWRKLSEVLAMESAS